MAFESIEEILDTFNKSDKELWQVILEDDLQEEKDFTIEKSLEHMKVLWETMKRGSLEYKEKDISNSGFSGGDGAKVIKAIQSGTLIGGTFLNRVISEALKTGECNACMKTIVACPTAGSCGVLPAVLIAYMEQNVKSKDIEEKIIKSLYISAGFGQVIATRASISGAEGGCQAEIGSASAMTAATLTYLMGGTAEMCANALAMALKNLLGLVCDPVAGLVEVPCIKRNVVGAVNAVACANMAIAGIESRIPVDEVIDAMGEVGRKMNSDLKETGIGGLAGTPTGKAFAESLRNKT